MLKIIYFNKYLLLIALFIILYIFHYINKIKEIKKTIKNTGSININNLIYNKNKNNKNCLLSPENSDKKIIHIIITNFMIEFYKSDGFIKKIYTNEYIKNGIRVIKKYLFPSLQYQSCQDFIWMLKIGNKANLSYINSLLNFERSFEIVIIYNKDYKNYIRNITKNFEILITTRIDYDDRIYWNAVNDVRKAINISKPILLYGYNRGFYYYEKYDIYTEFFRDYKNEGTMSIFQSLIIIKNKVNDSYTIYDIGGHSKARKNLLKNYKKFGLEKLDYEPAIIEVDVPKFVWVRQHYSGTIRFYKKPKTKAVYFDLNKFYGIKT